MKNRIFIVEGMSCAACSAGIERSLRKKEGIITAEVNLLMKRLNVTFDEDVINEERIIEIVHKTGFTAMLEEDIEIEHSSTKTAMDKQKKKDQVEQKNELLTLIVSLTLSALLMIISMGQMLFPQLQYKGIFSITENPYNFAIIQLILTLIILMLNKKFFQNGISSLLKLHPNMDSLVALSASASLIFSVVMTFHIKNNPHAVHNLYYESAAMVVALVSLGKYMENNNTRKTKSQITALMNLTPDDAILVTPEGSKKVATEKIKVSDVIQVSAGSKIALDGKIISGDAEIDESMITGESIPVHRKIGDEVIGGTILVNGLVMIEVTRVGKDTTISKIIKFVEEAQGKKAPISQIADKIAAVFVPAVIGISTLAAIIWLLVGQDLSFALKIFTSVLVIACPCAMGLATPTAIVVATGRGATEGILIRNGEALQKVSEIDMIMFDKTGTITTGNPEVTDIIGGDHILAGAYMLSKFSDHPLSKAICKHAESKGLGDTAITMEKLSKFQNTPGMGLSAELGNHLILTGNTKLLDKYHIDYSTQEEKIRDIQSHGKTIVLFATTPVDGLKNGEHEKAQAEIGIIALADQIKPEAAEAMKELEKMHISTMLLTGDNKRTAEYIAAQANITTYNAELLPQNKSEIITQKREEGHKTMMVGDGINDAPALAAADIGCAVGSGSDIAIESADLILMHNDIRDVPKSIKLGKVTLRIIKENLFWAFCYNVLAIPVAAGAFYHSFGLLLSPMIGAIAMSLSSLFVVTNSLRLLRTKINH